MRIRVDVALRVKESIKVSLVKEKKKSYIPDFFTYEASWRVKNRVKITQNSKVSATQLGNAL